MTTIADKIAAQIGSQTLKALNASSLVALGRGLMFNVSAPTYGRKLVEVVQVGDDAYTVTVTKVSKNRGIAGQIETSTLSPVAFAALRKTVETVAGVCLGLI